MQDASITPKFRNFIVNLLRFRCLLKEETVNKYFDTPEGMKTLRQAFIHKSFSVNSNYELLEFEGDVIVNLSVVEYIRGHFPHITNVGRNTRIKHTLISGRFLAKLAINNGFESFLIVNKELQDKFDTYEIKLDYIEYEKAYEDTVEALCGAINQILNKNTAKGVGYVACYNLISSFLDEIDIPTAYEEVFDAISRMKELFDSKQWNDPNVFPVKCNSNNCLQVFPVDNFSIEKYKKESRQFGLKLDQNILNAKNGFITFGYACDTQSISSHSSHGGSSKNVGDYKKILLGVAIDNKKKESSKKAAEIVIKELNKRGISMDVPVAYTQ